MIEKFATFFIEMSKKKKVREESKYTIKMLDGGHLGRRDMNSRMQNQFGSVAIRLNCYDCKRQYTNCRVNMAQRLQNTW